MPAKRMCPAGLVRMHPPSILSSAKQQSHSKQGQTEQAALFGGMDMAKRGCHGGLTKSTLHLAEASKTLVQELLPRLPTERDCRAKAMTVVNSSMWRRRQQCVFWLSQSNQLKGAAYFPRPENLENLPGIRREGLGIWELD